LFTNVEEKAVISAKDLDHIYKIPQWLHDQGLDEIVADKLRLDIPEADLSDWQEVVYTLENPESEVVIGMVGKYVNLTESYKSLNESLSHAGIQNKAKVRIIYIDSETLEGGDLRQLEGLDAILVPGGFGKRGVEGKIAAVQYARENKVPYLGICLGMQVAVVEYARHKADMSDAHSTEFNPETEHPVIALITEWKSESGETEVRDENSDLGGTMRLGAQPCSLMKDSNASRIYGAEQISERHRHRYEFNNTYMADLEEKGLVFSGRSVDGNLVEMVEIPEHPWFVACQFHPEFTSTPRKGHPLFTDFIKAACTHRDLIGQERGEN